MRDATQLITDSFIDKAVIVSVQIGPDRRIRIKVLAPLHVLEFGAGPTHDNDRLAFEPIAHLGEWMPDVALIQGRQPRRDVT